jgi:hypothetical protein
MSALCHSRHRAASLDHLVGAREQRRRHFKAAAETAGTAETQPHVWLAIIPDRFLQFLRFLHCGLGLVGGGVDGRINDPPQYRPAALPATWFPQAAQPPSGG